MLTLHPRESSSERRRDAHTPPRAGGKGLTGPEGIEGIRGGPGVNPFRFFPICVPARARSRIWTWLCYSLVQVIEVVPFLLGIRPLWRLKLIAPIVYLDPPSFSDPSPIVWLDPHSFSNPAICVRHPTPLECSCLCPSLFSLTSLGSLDSRVCTAKAARQLEKSRSTPVRQSRNLKRRVM